MYNVSGKKVLKLVLAIAMIVLGIYMTFFHEDSSDTQKAEEAKRVEHIQTEKEEGASTEKMVTNAYDYTNQELPTEENISDAELYNGEKEVVEVYFANTEVLDHGNMPLEVQKILCERVQKYLRVNGYADVTELYIDSESYFEDAEKIGFRCFLDGHEEILQIEYWIAERTLKYAVLLLDEEMNEKIQGGDDA